MRIETTVPYGERRDAISHEWMVFCDALGWVPILCPNSLSNPVEWFDSQSAHGIILTGGNDIGSEPMRDGTEQALVNCCLERRYPILGVCRGFQFLNCHFGGQLTRDLSTAQGSSNTFHTGTRHDVFLEHPLSRGSEDVVNVNSFHCQGVLKKQLAPCLNRIASNEDVVEAYASRELSVFGVQWHPEREKSIQPVDQVITSWFQAAINEKGII